MKKTFITLLLATSLSACSTFDWNEMNGLEKAATVIGAMIVVDSAGLFDKPAYHKCHVEYDPQGRETSHQRCY